MLFPRGCYYQIICKSNEKALRIEQTDQGKFEKSRINYEDPAIKSDYSLWMIQKVGQGDSDFEIVNCRSTYVMDEQGSQIKLRKGKRASDQLYGIQEALAVNANSFHKYYYIRDKIGGKQALYLQGTLKYGDFDENKPNYLFRFQKVMTPTIQNSCLIINHAAEKALDVPDATFKKESQIVQWEINRRWNQRFRVVRKGNTEFFFIESLLNGYVLDIKGAKMKKGTKVIQWDRSGDDNQLWRIVPDGQNVKFASKADQSFYLRIDDGSNKDGAGLQIDNEPTIFRIEGKVLN